MCNKWVKRKRLGLVNTPTRKEDHYLTTTISDNLEVRRWRSNSYRELILVVHIGLKVVSNIVGEPSDLVQSINKPTMIMALR